MPDRLDLNALRPADTPAYMTPAWLGCISWALGEKEVVTAYREDTGEQLFLESLIRWAGGPRMRTARSSRTGRCQ